MKIHRVHLRDKEGRSIEYSYFLNIKEAKKHLRKSENVFDDQDMDTIDINISRTGILHALNTYASHPDNG